VEIEIVTLKVVSNTLNFVILPWFSTS